MGDEKKTERKKNEIPGVIEKKNRNGEITGYKFMRCVGRDETYRQIWRTTTISRTDPRIIGLTPAKLRKALAALKTSWDDQVQSEYNESHTKTVDKKGMTFHDFVENHWKANHVKDNLHSPNTISFFNATAKTSLDYFGKKIKLVEITPELTKQYIKYLSTAKNNKGVTYSGTSQMHHYATFRNIMEYAYRMGYIDQDPCTRMSEKEIPKRNKKPINFLTADEAKRFLSCIDKELADAEKTGKLGTIRKAAMWRCYVYILITTGLRRAEAVALLWGDVNVDQSTIKISKSICIDKNADKGWIVKGTKTGNHRTVALLPSVYDILCDYKAICAKYFDLDEADALPDDAYIFCNDSSFNIPIYVTSPTRMFELFVERNGLREITPHGLRRTAASLALESGAGIKEISELLGHSDISTTSKFYTALTESTKRRTVEGIGNILF